MTTYVPILPNKNILSTPEIHTFQTVANNQTEKFENVWSKKILQIYMEAFSLGSVNISRQYAINCLSGHSSTAH